MTTKFLRNIFLILLLLLVIGVTCWNPTRPSAAAQAGYPGPYPGPATPTTTIPPATTTTAAATITPYPTRTPQATPHYTAVKLQSFSAERINKWP